ncbi:MAG: tetratricopeptide repeat protein [Chloroflexia bacterium]|nr:tetratricopeptide repeat protein [Chloroflexia bacterium]
MTSQEVSVTFLFTDIEGSTRLWEQYPEAMQAALARHDEIMRRAIEGHGGRVFKTLGDAFYACFETAPAALAAALEAQQALHDEPWEGTGPLRVRMALHTGPAEERDGDYFGLSLSRVDRLLHAGHGGQILLSLSTQELIGESLPSGSRLRDLGERRLKDLVCREHIFQFVAPDLPSDFPPLRTLDAHPTNLPAQATLFVGREREMAEIKALLQREGVRLVTLSGAGGSGKTRLALQVAADLLEHFGDGVYFVPLAAIRNPDLVVPTITHILDFKEPPDQDLLTGLKQHLQPKEMLLVLDNLEQVVGAAPQLAELLASAPGLKFLVTSRIVLRLYGEYEYIVPPLAVPDLRAHPTVQDMARYPAVALFVERARAVRPNFGLNEGNAPAVAEICRRLDGLPLAIELAAARSKLFSPQAMLARFRGPPRRSSLQILTGGPRDLPARQQTLRGAIDWSYELLAEAEQRLFARLAVFVGGCTIEAAEALCNAGGDLETDVVDGLLALVDQSVLRRGESEDGEPYFTMLETIREYAHERLAQSGEENELWRRYAHYYLALVERAIPELFGPRQMYWVARLEQEHDNLRAALAWALEQEEPELALRLSGQLGKFWHTRGYISEGRRWLEEILARSRSLEAPALRAQALEEAGALAHEQGDNAHGQDYLEQAIALRRELGDPAGLAYAYHRLAALIMYERKFEQAQHYLEQSLQLWQKVGLESKIASTINNLGLLAMYQGDLQRAMELHRQSLALFRQEGNRYGEVSSLLLLGYEALELEQLEQAATYCRQALARLGEQGDVRRVIEGLEIYAGVLSAQGQADRAVQLCGTAERLREQFEVPLPDIDRPFIERIQQTARAVLGEQDLAQASARGRAMSAERAIAYALES